MIRQMARYLSHRRQSFAFAIRGCLHAIRTQKNMQIHLAVAFIASIAAFTFQIPVAHWIGLLLTIGLVLSCEVFNTSIEVLGDAVSNDLDPLVGQAKDLAAGATLVASIIALAIGLVIFLPPIVKMFFG